MDLGLHDKVCVVLASSAGIGRACAESLLGEGAQVAVSGRNAARLDGFLEQLDAEKRERCHAQALDVTDIDALGAHIGDVEARMGPIDVLVWNSGGPPPASADRIDESDLRAAYEGLLAPAVSAIHAVLPGMRERGFGRVIALTSIAVRQPISNLALSNVMRSGLTAFLKSLSLEVGSDGVTVNSICTGFFATDRTRQLAEARAVASGKSVEAERAAMIEGVPAGRYGEPRELGDVVAFLCSPRAAYVHGVALPIDGGCSRFLL